MPKSNKSILVINNLKNNCKKPVLLCILDGWGIGDNNSQNNAIALAKLPNYYQILSNYPHSQLYTSGLAVGLPEGQMGNSEVGHAAIGSGRIIFQNLPKINNAIQDKSLEKNKKLQDLIKSCQEASGVCHLTGLLSDGGVHCHIDHIVDLAKILAKNDIFVKLHCFLDGRDTPQKSAIKYIIELQDYIKQNSNITIATISGRYFAMDRDNNWDRINLAYEAIIRGEGEHCIDPILAISQSYDNSITDEFIKPVVIGDYHGTKDGDAILFANFRADRVRQISTALFDPDFKEFPARDVNFSARVSMVSYSEKLDYYFDVLFPSENVKNSLGEVLSSLNLKQLRIAETEKYAHVTFFFSGGREQEFIGEDRILVQSPAVKTYDLKPEMSAAKVGDNLQKAIESDKYDFIVVNYANPDMVGHSGCLESSIKACQTIDIEVGKLKELILKKDGIMIISADHGNIETMVDEKGNPHTAHTTNPVPFILIGNDVKNLQLKNGNLSDIAPTILSLMKINKPPEMTGDDLIYQSQ